MGNYNVSRDKKTGLKMHKKKGALRTGKLRQTNRGKQDKYPPNKQPAVGIQQRKDTSTPDVQDRSRQPEKLIFNKGTMNP